MGETRTSETQGSLSGVENYLLGSSRLDYGDGDGNDDVTNIK